MYRDDVCAVCGESLPPDHFYCRQHATGVDERLHEIGALLPQLTADLTRLTELLGQVAPETWDYCAEGQPGDPLWPPVPELRLRADPDEVAVDVDAEPGFVQVRLRVGVQPLLAALAASLDGPVWEAFAETLRETTGANATH